VNIRSILRPTCSREPTEAQWELLEDALEPLLRVLPAGTDLSATLDPLPHVAAWRRRFDLERDS